MAEQSNNPVGGSSNIEPPTGPTQKASVPNRQAFESHMEQAEEQVSGVGQGPTPLELEQGSNPPKGAPTLESLNNQFGHVQNKFREVQKQLNTPKLTLNKTDSDILNTKLSGANNHLNRLANHLGAGQIDNTPVPRGAGPIVKFLAMVTDGQNRMVLAQKEISKYSKSKDKMNPADMLLVQTKLAQAQQEIEYSSILLSNSVSSLKQMMNIQL